MLETELVNVLREIKSQTPHPALSPEAGARGWKLVAPRRLTSGSGPVAAEQGRRGVQHRRDHRTELARLAWMILLDLGKGDAQLLDHTQRGDQLRARIGQRLPDEQMPRL